MKKIFNLIIFALLLSFQLYGQQMSVHGTVLDESGLPLPGVSVIISGTSVGTSTDGNGNYSLEVEKGNVLKFSFVGYTYPDIVVDDKTEYNASMVPSYLELEQVVVTALGIKREKKALGYTVQDINSEDLTSTGSSDISSALQGKISGLTISPSGSGVGGSSRIEIRGASSLSDNNNPLIVVDGVPFNSSSSFIDSDNNETDDQASVWGGSEKGGGITDINPEDIESVSVLKGPNAAALYGSRAGNGVILITTKKGSGKGLNINYSGNVTFSKAAYLLDMQNEYGQGSNNVYDANGVYSWGPKMEGQMLESWTGETIAYTAEPDKLKNFTRTGVSQSHNLSLSSSGDKGSMRVSLSKNIENGIYEGHSVDRTNFDLNATYDVNKWLNVDAKASYFNTEGKGRPEMGFYSLSSYFYKIPSNIRTADLQPGYEIVNSEHQEILYTTANANYRNPYFLQAQIYNNDERHRGFGYLAANVTFTPELKLKVKYGLDFYNEKGIDGYYYADNVNSNRPNYNTYSKFFKEENAEFLLSYNKTFGDISFSLNAGGNRMYSYAHKLSAGSGLLPSEGYYFLSFGTNISASEEFREQEVQSLYGFTQLGYKNYLYLDITARNDWSSTLPVDNCSYFYPSFSLSAIISEMTQLPQWISFAKVRTSWAQVGKATEPYMTNSNYTISTGNYNYLNAAVPGTLINPNLKPEISSSFEIGSDLRFLNNRIGLDFTYYNGKTKNQILKVDTDQSTGYSHKLINAGLISNEGIELMFNANLIKRKDFNLDFTLNFSKNATTVDELDEDTKEHEFGNVNDLVYVVATEGEKMGGIKGKKYMRDDSGKIIVDSEGLPTYAQSLDIIGNIQPDWTGSVSLKADYKGFFLSSLISVRQGGEYFSITEQSAAALGTAKRTADNNRSDFVFDGVTESGDVNNVSVSAQQYWTRVATIDEEFIYDASYMKMSEMALGYTFSKKLLSRIPYEPFKNARFSLVGRNLFYFYKHSPGTAPDASAYSNSYAAQAFDLAPVPATRTYGFSINLGF